MRRWPKQKRFWWLEGGRRYREPRKMSPEWLHRRRRYLEEIGFFPGGILFRRVDLTEAQELLGRVSRRAPRPSSMRVLSGKRWSWRLRPRQRVRGQWREVTS